MGQFVLVYCVTTRPHSSGSLCTHPIERIARASAAWIFEETNSTDLSRAFIKDGLKHGVRFNLMHSISREERPEAEWPRTNVQILGQAFNLTNTTNQDPNVKWFVVGSSGYKKAIYPQIKEWGFNIVPCSDSAARKGYPWCGPNSLYEWEEPGLDSLVGRQRSPLWKYYEAMETANFPNKEDDCPTKTRRKRKLSQKMHGEFKQLRKARPRDD